MKTLFIIVYLDILIIYDRDKSIASEIDYRCYYITESIYIYTYIYIYMHAMMIVKNYICIYIYT